MRKERRIARRNDRKNNRKNNSKFSKLFNAIRQFSEINRSLYIILIALFVSSCEPAPWTNGKPVTETRYFGDSVNITAIHVYHDINVTLIESDEFRIDVTTGENLMEKITSTVENGILYLKNENIRYWIRSYDYPLEVKIYHNSINCINYESWGDLTSEGHIFQDTIGRFDLNVLHGSGHIDLSLNCKSLIVRTHDGTAKVTLSGSTDYTDIYHNARNNIYSKELVSKDACVHVHYEGSVYVNCINRLEAMVNDYGSIYYNRELKELDATITDTPVPNSRGVIEPYN
ncbi:MAG: DUF2807 domain-containing protein [Bacteroidales bacterium]|nr:DUF2807 domain-containing protein [Bacteroidales bacterium]